MEIQGVAMEALRKDRGQVVPLDRQNVDTDQIIPKQFLKRIERTGYGEFLFFDWRSRPDGTPVQEFVLNDRRYSGGSILVADRNFGCGSSREHAAWALTDYGFRTVIAPSFADIFFNNCFKNGFLPLVLPKAVCVDLIDDAERGANATLTIDLERQVVIQADGTELPFEVQAFRKYCRLNGFDDIGLTLRHADKIKAFEARRLTEKPWLARTLIG